MAHVALLGVDGVVQQVHVINNEDLPDNGAFTPDVESAANAFQHALGFEGVWRLTSYNNNFRGRYARIGDRYDAELDEFVSPQPAEPIEPVTD